MVEMNVPSSAPTPHEVLLTCWLVISCPMCSTLVQDRASASSAVSKIEFRTLEELISDKLYRLISETPMTSVITNSDIDINNNFCI